MQLEEKEPEQKQDEQKQDDSAVSTNSKKRKFDEITDPDQAVNDDESRKQRKL